MNRRKWLWASLVVAPLVVGGGIACASTLGARGGFTCPVTGEQLPCEKCCPLNGEKAAQAEVKAAKPAAETAGEYVCPLTGENLGCPNCCPLNKAKK